MFPFPPFSPGVNAAWTTRFERGSLSETSEVRCVGLTHSSNVSCLPPDLFSLVEWTLSGPLHSHTPAQRDCCRVPSRACTSAFCPLEFDDLGCVLHSGARSSRSQHHCTQDAEQGNSAAHASEHQIWERDGERAVRSSPPFSSAVSPEPLQEPRPCPGSGRGHWPGLLQPGAMEKRARAPAGRQPHRRLSRRLGCCNLTAAGCKDLAAVLGTVPSLVQLDLSDNPLEDGGVRELCGALAGPGCSVQKLWYGASGWRVLLCGCSQQMLLGCERGQGWPCGWVCCSAPAAPRCSP